MVMVEKMKKVNVEYYSFLSKDHIREYDKGAWSKWTIVDDVLTENLLVWFRVKVLNYAPLRMFVEVRERKHDVSFSCYLNRDRLYYDFEDDQFVYKRWMFQAIQCVLPGIRELNVKKIDYDDVLMRYDDNVLIKKCVNE
jgi:hypothetical protein